MGIMKRIMSMRIIDLGISLFCAAFMVCLVLINLHLSSHLSTKDELSPITVNGKVQEVVPREQSRVRRQTEDTSTWTIPQDPYPIVLGVPYDGCQNLNLLYNDFPNAACYEQCNSAPCSDNATANVLSGKAELVCTARIMTLGFKRTSEFLITDWIKKHPSVSYKIGNAFIKNGAVNFDDCPDVQISDTTTDFYFTPYTSSDIGKSQKHYYLHCESCLSSGLTDFYFGSVFLDIPTALLQYFSMPEMKFIITLKNPTDRVFAEYFYKYQVAGTDLDTVGGEILHEAMSNAITQVQECMAELGPTACVYGVTPTSWSSGRVIYEEATMIYESCYSTRLAQVTQQIDFNKVYFMMIEEYAADPITQIQDLYQFIGLDYPGPIAMPTGAHVHKPILTKTIEMLDSFFSPFNTELSTMLGDSKWLYPRVYHTHK